MTAAAAAAALVAQELEVRLPEAAGADAKGVIKAQVAACLWAAGEGGSGRKNSRTIESLLSCRHA